MEKTKRRAFRRVQDQRMIRNRLRLLAQIDPTYYNIVCDEPGFLRKRHPFDCGHPKCFVCHSDKIQNKTSRRRKFKER